VSAFAAAYAALLSMPRESAAARQELRAVSECCHVKVSLLLLHQQRFEEAAAQLRSHFDAFGRLPAGVPAGETAEHHAWRFRQAVSAATMVAGSKAPPDGALNQLGLRYSAVHAALAWSAACRDAAAAAQPVVMQEAEVRKGPWLGQLLGRRADATAEWSPLGDDALRTHWAALHSSPKSLAAAQRGLAAVAGQAGAPRLSAFCGYGGAAAAAAGGGADASRSSGSHLPSVQSALLSAAALYRREGWDVLLAQTCDRLVAVASRIGDGRVRVAAALELSTLRGPAAEGCRALASAAIQAAIAGDAGRRSALHTAAAAPTPGAFRFVVRGDECDADASSPDGALWRAVAVAVGLESCGGGAAVARVSLLNCLPVELPVERLAAHLGAGGGMVEADLGGLSVLRPGAWHTFHAPLPSAVLPAAVTLDIGGAFSVCWAVSTFANSSAPTLGDLAARASLPSPPPPPFLAAGTSDTAAGGLSPDTTGELGELEPPLRVEWRCQSEPGCHLLPLAAERGAAETSLPLVVGSPALLTACCRATGSLEILGAAFEPPPLAALQAMNDLAEQLPPGVPTTLAAGAAVCLALRLMPTRATAVAASGRLRIIWRSSGDGAAITAWVPLPSLAIVDTVIAARVLCPAEARAGVAFSLAIAVSNASGEAQSISASLPDAPGFLVGGERTVTLVLQPRERAIATFKLVAAAAGRQPLPRVLCACASLQCTLATTATHITVL